jgi:hypothetical protein
MRALRFALAPVLALACANQSVVGGIDVATVADTPDVTPPTDAFDAAVAMDAVDVAPPLDVAPDLGPDDVRVPGMCRGDDDCAGSPDGAVCDPDTRRCVGCTATRNDCGAGQYCDTAMRRCLSGCQDDDACRAASTGDGGVARSLRCDPSSRACVACVVDAHCPAGTLCVGNVCVAGCNPGRACPTGQSCCNGGCVDPQANTAHCGGCGQACSVANASAACANGTCAVGMCMAPFGDCDTAASNGCETDTSTSLAHCGGCNRACESRPNTAARCEAGRCGYTCTPGFADCDGVESNGCEVDIRASTDHCGGCGLRCDPANATARCEMGRCAVGACAADFGDCDGNATNGCEADLRSTLAHCGACGRGCASAPNSLVVCAARSCQRVCATGFADCDGDASNGCEVDTRTSNAHCGGCGMACANVGGAVACTAGACAVTRCDAGRADCNGNGRDGCEVTLASDAAHCGACGNACPSVEARRLCTAGSCAPTSCRAVLQATPGLPDGRYRLDLDGDASGAARDYACDMRNGGWTYVANQVPATLLDDVLTTVNETLIGQLDRSWRLGNPEITRVRPAVAWRLSDEVQNVFVAPACVVDWSQDYIRVTTPHPCTTGYTTPALNTLVNGRWTFCSARGIGINNEGRSCSIRMNESGFGLGIGALPNGRAYTCDYNTARRVSLAFQ